MYAIITKSALNLVWRCLFGINSRRRADETIGNLQMIKASLRYFGAVVQHGSIRAASEALHVAQSAVSRQLQSLEQELDVQLLERRARGILPTPAGELLYRYFRDASFQIERMHSELDALQGLRRGNVRIATVESLIAGLLPDAIDKFRSRHPGVTFNVMISGSDGVAQAVRSGEAEMGFGFSLGSSPEFNVVYRVREPILAIMSPKHALAKAHTLSLSRLAGWPITLSLRWSGTRHLVEAAAAAAGITIEPALETNSVELQHRFARTGQGIAFLPRLPAVQSVKTGLIAAVPISDPVLNAGTFDIITLATRKLPLAAEEFIGMARQELQKHFLKTTR
jgi:DNA-binding transcriptional LysR family regulator